MAYQNASCPKLTDASETVENAASAVAVDRTWHSDEFVRELTERVVREYFSPLRPSVRMLHRKACFEIAEREAASGTALAKPSLGTLHRLVRNASKKLTDRRRYRRHSTRRGSSVNKPIDRAAAKRSANRR